MKIRAALAAVTLFATMPCLAGEGEPLGDKELVMQAATRIFALENHLHGDIGVADEDEGHIGERFEVNHAPGKTCTFTMRHRDGPIIESISFDRLSGEHSIRRQDGYYLIDISGLPEAQCEIDGSSRKCSDTLEMLLTGEELQLAGRALRFMFDNACRPAQLPF